ncbi:MAG: hypothetical protein WBC71_10000 [Salaquimonas sp.]
MKVFSPSNLAGLFFAASILFLIEYFGFWTGILTHPFWSSMVNWFGMGIGFVVALILLLISGGRSKTLGIFSLVLILFALGAYFTTVHFKEVFAASYAENVLAGKMWYFGFMAFVASLFALLALIPAYLFADE